MNVRPEDEEIQAKAEEIYTQLMAGSGYQPSLPPGTKLSQNGKVYVVDENGVPQEQKEKKPTPDDKPSREEIRQPSPLSAEDSQKTERTNRSPAESGLTVKKDEEPEEQPAKENKPQGDPVKYDPSLSGGFPAKTGKRRREADNLAGQQDRLCLQGIKRALQQATTPKNDSTDNFWFVECRKKRAQRHV